MKKHWVMLLAATAVSCTLSGAALAKSCKPSVYHGSNAALMTGHRKTLAQENAIASWELRVLTSIGPDWANWSNATSKNFRCIKTLAKRWKCTANARPCDG